MVFSYLLCFVSKSRVFKKQLVFLSVAYYVSQNKLQSLSGKVFTSLVPHHSLPKIWNVGSLITSVSLMRHVPSCNIPCQILETSWSPESQSSVCNIDFQSVQRAPLFYKRILLCMQLWNCSSIVFYVLFLRILLVERNSSHFVPSATTDFYREGHIELSHGECNCFI